jgi:hypothetical protein
MPGYYPAGLPLNNIEREELIEQYLKDFVYPKPALPPTSPSILGQSTDLILGVANVATLGITNSILPGGNARSDVDMDPATRAKKAQGQTFNEFSEWFLAVASVLTRIKRTLSIPDPDIVYVYEDEEDEVPTAENSNWLVDQSVRLGPVASGARGVAAAQGDWALSDDGSEGDDDHNGHLAGGHTLVIENRGNMAHLNNAVQNTAVGLISNTAESGIGAMTALVNTTTNIVTAGQFSFTRPTNPKANEIDFEAFGILDGDSSEAESDDDHKAFQVKILKDAPNSSQARF